MALRRGEDPTGRLGREVQELIDELWQVPRFSGSRRGFRPQVDVVRVEEPPGFRVVVEIPGIDPEAVRLYADANTLVVAGDRNRPAEGRYFHMEIAYGPFQRRIQFSEQVDPSRATADYRRGLLTIALPLAEHAPARERVVIQVGRPS